MTKHMTYSERFNQKITKTQTCWLWIGAKCTGGYGIFWYNGKLVNAHRFSYLQHKGEIPDGLYICHLCDTRECVNPEHLWLGTASENMRDMIAKNRQGKNMRKKTHCRKKHEYTPENTRIKSKQGKKYQQCKTCEKDERTERLRRKRAQVLEIH